jgi:hypothetical protein
MTGFDIGALIIAIRAAVPTAKLKVFEETLYRAAMSPCASDELRWALGIEPRESGPHRPFSVIPGGAA